MNVLLLNPDGTQLLYALEQAVEEANSGLKIRLCQPLSGAKAFSSPDGVHETNGGAVANSYGWKANTAQAGYAWWTDPRGNLHVRVIGQRTTIQGRHVPGLFFPETWNVHPAAQVYPELYVPRSQWRKARGEEKAFLGAILEDPADPATRAAYTDWLEQRGRHHETETERRALEVCLQIAASLPQNA